ncbi:PREDICTED: nuclear RNA export factor 5-like, partial [Chinchilla lanigera]|uniref:nuclear RNA export factor 5-like n=1 Tax=Chinchilla lanigera TaxID=34839 RepID=UPI000698822E
VRYAPYARGHNRKRGRGYGTYNIQINLFSRPKYRGREVGKGTQDKTAESWFKITVPYGAKYDRAWLLNLIQSHCSVPFSPVDFHCIERRALFFVQGTSSAYAIKDASNKIYDTDNRKITLFVSPSVVPYSEQDKYTPEEMEQLKLTMRKRYDVSQQALNLQKLRFDAGLVGHNIDMILNRRNCMVATLQIIESDFPQ